VIALVTPVIQHKASRSYSCIRFCPESVLYFTFFIQLPSLVWVILPQVMRDCGRNGGRSGFELF
jgi:hypothetical protein